MKKVKGITILVLCAIAVFLVFTKHWQIATIIAISICLWNTATRGKK
jgi:hypothetical protein